MRRLRVGDRVVIISGEDRGKTGTVKAVQPEHDRVVVEGIRRVKKHLKAMPTRPGGILDVEAPLPSSKVMLIDPETGKRTRVRHEVRDGAKVRLAKSGSVITAEVKE